MTVNVKAYRVPANVKSLDHTIKLPIEIHHEQDGPWYAVYWDEYDIEYPDLHSLAKAHELDLASDEPESWDSYSWIRTEPRDNPTASQFRVPVLSMPFDGT